MAALSLFLLLISVGWPLSALRTQEGPFILRYDTLSGAALAGGWKTLATIFFTEAVILFLGWFLAGKLYREARFVSYLLVAGSLVSSVFFLAFSLMLTRLN